MPQIKGAVIRARLLFVQELAPDGGLERVLERLTPAEGKELRSLLATNWYPLELGLRLDQAIVDVLGGGRTEFFEELGVASANKNLAGVHRGFVVADDPHAFLANAPTIYGFYYDKGHRTYERVGPHEAVLTTHDAETFSVADCATVVGWHRRAVELCGGLDPKVVEEECRARGGDVCRYRITWR